MIVPPPLGHLATFDAATLPARLGGLCPAAVPFALAALDAALPDDAIVVTRTQEEGERLRRDLLELRAMRGGLSRRVLLFASPETSAYEDFSPGNEAKGDRLRTIEHILEGEGRRLVIAPVAGLLRRTLTPALFRAHRLVFRAGQSADLESVGRILVAGGYERLPKVEEPGQFSIRGGILDLHAPGDPWPHRIEFFGDEIESVRLFDPIDQRSLEAVAELTVPPASELVLTPATQDRALSSGIEDPLLPVVAAGGRAPGIERLMPSAYEATVTLRDLLPDACLVAVEPEGIAREARERLADEHRRRRGRDGEKPHAHPPEAYHADPDDLLAAPRLALREDASAGDADLDTAPLTGFSGKLSEMLYRLQQELEEGATVHVFLPTAGQLKRVERLVREANLPVHPFYERPDGLRERAVNLIPGNLSGGFRSIAARTVVIAPPDIYGRDAGHSRAAKRLARKTRSVFHLSELREGDHVVHVNYGIGIYRGISTLKVQGREHDYISVDYAGDEKLFIPCENIHLIHKYVALEGGEPKLNSLSDGAWKRSKSSAKRAADTLAKELVELYARRAKAPGHAFPEDCDMQRELESAFPYQETPDQAEAIRRVKSDMREGKPMDRLVCGDVGFGKTEVAVRAAFKAALGGKQVAVLAPTTILALQHYNTFSARYGTFPVRVALLSRFRSNAEIALAVKAIERGEIDVAVGTHRLLQEDVRFRDLGLIVVDEEQRFGVKHKERLKAMREHVDVLSMSATPIPRTLYMSLTGARDLSVINTPPTDRLPIKTVVARYDESEVKRAIERELARHGQVYFVHNRVGTIEYMAMRIKKLVPEARVRAAHGQMDEKELERLMIDFYEKRYDVLVSTTIIENGLDIPSVNTIILERADTFGLSTLYQLRGRVGRSKTQAFAYFFYPEDTVLTGIARKRLQTIKDCSDLGSGYKIAMRDLEIRGAGNLLGYKQHGHIVQIGFEMYCELLKQAVAELSGEGKPAPEIEVEFELEAHLPGSYVEDPDQKIELYKRMAEVAEIAEADALLEEIIDRFGPPPRSVRSLLEVVRLRAVLRRVGAVKVKEEPKHVIVKFAPDAAIDPVRVTVAAHRYRNLLQFVPGEATLLYIKKESYRGDNLVVFVRDVLASLVG